MDNVLIQIKQNLESIKRILDHFVGADKMVLTGIKNDTFLPARVKRF